MDQILNEGYIVHLMAEKHGSRSFITAISPGQSISHWTQITLAFYTCPSGKLNANRIRLSAGAKTAVSSNRLMVVIPGPRLHANQLYRRGCWVRLAWLFLLLEGIASGLLLMQKMELCSDPMMEVRTGSALVRIAICARVRGITSISMPIQRILIPSGTWMSRP